MAMLIKPKTRRSIRTAVALAASALLLGACWKPSFSADYTFSVASNIIYGQGEVGGGSFVDLKLDVYKPQETGQTRFPLVVVVHGGGFTGGSKTQGNVTDWAKAFASRGYIVASIDYRLQGSDPVPSVRVQPMYDAVLAQGGDPQAIAAVAAVDDTLSALDFLQSRPDVLDDKTVLIGGSAGAVTVDYLAYALDNFGIERPPVKAVVSNWGGFPVGSANTLIGPGEPPIFLAHGTDDPTVPYSFSTDIEARTQALGIAHQLYTKTGGKHGFNLVTEQYSPGRSVLQAQIDFVTCALFYPADTSEPSCTF